VLQRGITSHGLIYGGPNLLREAGSAYKFSQFLATSIHEAFDQLHNPGAATPYSGIYRCEGCGREVTSVSNHALPPQNHHQHTPAQGAIRWRLIVCDKGKSA
jgi:hypothetical protein